MTHHFLRSVGAAGLAVAIGLIQVPRDSTSCQFSIVSSTVVVTYCGHRDGDEEVMDVLIAWRGMPGWFQRGMGRSGQGGRRTFSVGLNGRPGTGIRGRVSDYATYNDVTISFDADFDAGTLSIGDETVPLKGVNALLIDHVDGAGAPAAPSRVWIEPRLPLGADVNLVLARRSRELRQFLRCDIPMPAASMPQPPVITVCEKLAAEPGK